MHITKESGIGRTVTPDEKELALVRQFSRKELTGEEVYLFAVRLCDNEIDRDGERFSGDTLEKLAELFVGKSGIFDHAWSARGQTARIYRTEVLTEPGVRTGAGDPYRYLKGYAYMLRTEGNRELIEEIEGGIKKEVSVGCAVEHKICSVCGKEFGGEGCGHVKGRTYNGKLCYAELRDASDAYEWSFVAVPAQPRAGVMQKNWKGGRPMTLKELASGEETCRKELEALEAQAELGRHYLGALRGDVVRLAALAEPGLGTAVLKSIAEKLGEEELLAVRTACEKRLDGEKPMETQLCFRTSGAAVQETDGAFLI